MSIELSVVLPIFNEAQNLAPLLDRIRAALDPLEIGYEIVCVDDGSTDETADRLATLSVADPRVRPLLLTRNFGKEAALEAGLESAVGEAAVFLDADLQHPPELIPQMVELWREQGVDVVDACKRSRGDEGPLHRAAAKLFHALLGASVDRDLRGSSDFKLLSRDAIDTIASLPERTRYFRGLVHWIGFETARLEFDVEARSAGTTGWSRLALLRYGIDSLLSFTTLPLVIIAVAGLGTTVVGAMLGCVALYQWATGTAVSGFTTVIGLLTLFSGLILSSLGTMSLYLARLVEEAKARPLFLIRPAKKPEPPAARR